MGDSVSSVDGRRGFVDVSKLSDMRCDGKVVYSLEVSRLL